MINPLLTKALDELQYLLSGEEFLVKDLFKGYEWSRIPRNDRLRLGTLFLDAVTSNPNLGVIALGKTSANQQKYSKM
ncbi:single-stranded DNA-binding protein [Falsibacillus pallidus]|uniref:single-stranded DNA-binding protein n=1 Tax=Falsibacillus pallidus TaxID=493781 RepID=UPI003D952AB9